MKKQIPLAAVIAPALLILAVVGYFLLVKPKQDAAGRLDEEIAELQSKIDLARAAEHRPASTDETGIRVAEVFRLTKAMPDREDMPGIMLELNAIAEATGVQFQSISPSGPLPQTGYTAMPIDLTFEGSYYDLADFLFRLRNLVLVRDGELHAHGRLFTLDSLDLHEGPQGFPQIQAALKVSAYVYAPAGADGGEPTGTTTAPPATTAPAQDAQALGGS